MIGLTTAVMHEGQNVNFVISARHITELVSERREITLDEMLAGTRVVDRLPGSTIPVQPRSIMTLPFAIRGQQGATLEGTYTVSGGAGNDVVVAEMTADNRVIVNSGRVSGYGQLKQHLERGSYALLFDNRFSTFARKSVSPGLPLSYYR